MSYFQTRREAITAERMSDDAYNDEMALMARYFAAEAAFRDAIRAVNRSSLFTKIAPEAFDDFAHDELPDPDSWLETIETEYHL